MSPERAFEGPDSFEQWQIAAASGWETEFGPGENEVSFLHCFPDDDLKHDHFHALETAFYLLDELSEINRHRPISYWMGSDLKPKGRKPCFRLAVELPLPGELFPVLGEAGKLIMQDPAKK